MTRVRNKLRNIEATRQGIAYVFAELYKDLYSSSNDETKDKLSSEDRPHFLEDQVVLQSLRKTPPSLFVPEVFSVTRLRGSGGMPEKAALYKTRHVNVKIAM